jgi:hypothetical protein
MIGELVQHHQVHHAELAGELEVGLKPLAQTGVLNDLPRFVGDVDQSLAAGALGGAGQQRTHPSRRAGHQDADRGRVAHGVQVEHEQFRVEVQAGSRRAVEHAAQRALAQVLESECRPAAVLGQGGRGGAQALRHLGGGGEHRARHPGQCRLPIGAGAHDPQRLAQRPRLQLAQRTTERRHRDRAQQLQLGMLLRT